MRGEGNALGCDSSALTDEVVWPVPAKNFNFFLWSPVPQDTVKRAGRRRRSRPGCRVAMGRDGGSMSTARGLRAGSWYDLRSRRGARAITGAALAALLPWFGSHAYAGDQW